jgi:predicted RNA-binding protein with TRAM domain
MQNKGRFEGDSSPVNVGDELDVTIEGVGEKGDGIAKIKGFIIFVANAKKNERVRIKVTKVLRNLGFGEVIGKSGALGKEEEEEPIEDALEDDDDGPQDTEEFGEELDE